MEEIVGVVREAGVLITICYCSRNATLRHSSWNVVYIPSLVDWNEGIPKS
jgi:hypothetical protein